jgi:hypothetical protein
MAVTHELLLLVPLIGLEKGYIGRAKAEGNSVEDAFNIFVDEQGEKQGVVLYHAAYFTIPGDDGTQYNAEFVNNLVQTYKNNERKGSIMIPHSRYEFVRDITDRL